MGDPLLSRAVLRPVRDGNAYEATVEQLATSVRLGVFAAGQRLPPERELAETLGVSRGTLREAIAALRDAGMVQTRRGRGGGSVVSYRASGGALNADADADAPADADADAHAAAAAAHLAVAVGPQQRARWRDTLDFRRVVEPGAVALAATRDLSADQRAWLVAARAEVEAAPDGSTHRQADSRLHLGLAALSRSDQLVAAVTHVQGVLHQMLAQIPVLAPNIAHSGAQHRVVVEAVLAGDGEAARRGMAEHCDSTASLLRGLLGLEEES